MSRSGSVILCVVFLGGCVDSVAPPDGGSPPGQPPAVVLPVALPALPISCRYDPVRGVARIGLSGAATEGQGAGARLHLFADERPFAPTALDGLDGQPLRWPVHRIARATGEPDLYLRVVALDERDRVRAASGQCRVHSRAQLTARVAAGVLVTDLSGVYARRLQPPGGSEAPPLEPLCGYPARLLPGQEAVAFVRPTGSAGRPGLVVAAWDRPGTPTVFAPDGAALGDHQTTTGAAYAASASGRFVAWLAGDEAGLYVWDRQGAAVATRVTPEHLDVRGFAFAGERLVLAAEHRARPGGDCGLYRVAPETGESSRLHPAERWPRCEHVSWWGDGAPVAVVDPRTATLQILRADGERVAVSVGEVEVAVGGALRAPTWQDGGRAVAFRFRRHRDAHWRLGRLRLADEPPRVERVAMSKSGDLLRLAVDPGSLALAWVEALYGEGDLGGQVRIHAPSVPEVAARPVAQPALTRLSWAPGGAQLLVSDGGEAPVVLDRRGDVVARLEGGDGSPECWSWATALATLNP